MNTLQNFIVVNSYVALWIVLSSGVILYNKWVLTEFGFPFPVALTMIHMAFCSALAFVLVRVTRVVKSENMTKDVYLRKIVPIGFLFSLVLWLGNSAYVYLSVSFIQMVKALMPCVVYIVAVAYQVETFRARVMFNMLIISFGVAVASYGNFCFSVFRLS